MATPPLSTEAERRVVLLFPPDEQELVRVILLEECGNNLPFLEQLGSAAMDRFRFAALKISEGSLARFDEAIRMAKSDWRDLLVGANFGDDPAIHESWLPSKAWG